MLAGMGASEVYPNAPVVLVALEVRHPTADPLSTSDVRKIKKQLGLHFPLESQGQAANFQVTVGVAEAEVTVETFARFLNRAKTAAISFRKEAIVVETSAYPGWDRFRGYVASALAARIGASPVVGVERVGLRYIDEVRVPSTDAGEVSWGDWIDGSLLGPPREIIDLPLDQWQGMGVYGTQPGTGLIARYGPRVGFAVDPNSDLRRPSPRDGGPFFLIDIDSFWTPTAEVPEFDIEVLMAQCDELHAPVRKLFEGVITHRLRDEVLRAND